MDEYLPSFFFFVGLHGTSKAAYDACLAARFHIPFPFTYDMNKK